VRGEDLIRASGEYANFLKSLDFAWKCGTIEVNTTLERNMNNRPNERHRRHLRNLTDLLSDEHTEITRQANVASGHLIEIDEQDPDTMTTSNRLASAQRAKRAFESLSELLDAQQSRVSRMRDEVNEMKKNIKTA
jgi:hypothetical protein